MMKRSRIQNRPIVLVGLAVLTILLGSLAWISVNNLGSVAITTTPSQLISPDEYQAQFNSGKEHALIDVRTPEEFNDGHIPGSININVETLANRLDEIPADMPIVVYCRSGNRSATAAKILVDAGFAPVYDLGGIQAWVTEGYPIE
jgi:rhodanese-related sulfurtransferase